MHLGSVCADVGPIDCLDRAVDGRLRDGQILERLRAGELESVVIALNLEP